MIQVTRALKQAPTTYSENTREGVTAQRSQERLTVMGTLNLEVSNERTEAHSYTRTEEGGFKEHSHVQGG